MIILSRINISPTKHTTKEIDEKLKDYMKQYKKYVLDEDMMLMLIPIDDPIYNEIKEFMHNHKEYYRDISEFFENKFTKKEIQHANAFELSLNRATVCGYDNVVPLDYYETCCEYGKFIGKQLKDYEVPSSEWKKRELAFSSMYTYLVSEKLKSAIESAGLTNISFRLVRFRRNKKEPIAYQLEEINCYLH